MRGLHEQPQLNPRAALERPAQFVPLPIIPGKTDRVDGPDPKGDEVVKYRARAARLSAHVHYVVHREPGLDGNFRPRGVNFEIPVQAEVPPRPPAAAPHTVARFP